MKAASYSLLGLFSLVGMSCEKDCGAAELTTVPSQPLVTRSGSHTNQPNGTQTLVINSKSELASYGGLASYADTVNFSRYTLLGGIASRTGGIFIGPQSVMVDCQGTYTYSVRIADGITQSPTTSLFGVLIPKLSSNTKVKFTVTE